MEGSGRLVIADSPQTDCIFAKLVERLAVPEWKRLGASRGVEVEIIDKDEKHKITIDSSGDKIEILCDSGDVMVKAESGKVEVKASEITVESTGGMTLKAAATMTIS